MRDIGELWVALAGMTDAIHNSPMQRSRKDGDTIIRTPPANIVLYDFLMFLSATALAVRACFLEL